MTKPKAKTTSAEPTQPDPELSQPMAPGGPPITVKLNPEVPSQAQVDAASGEVAGPAVTKVTVEVEDGENIEVELKPDDAARISSQVAATSSTAEAHASPAWSNPNLREPTEEEIEADQAAYAERFGNGAAEPAAEPVPA